MQMKCFIQFLAFMFFISVLSVNADQKMQADVSDMIPVAVVRQPRYDFQSVVDGTIVTHAFIIENQGKAPLNIKKVRTSCGCTTADYSKVIAPGEEGNITIKGNTRGYGGKTFSKIITVLTNDPKQKQMKFHINGKVESLMLIEPKRLFLSGTTEDHIQARVTITPLKKYPFHIISSSADKDIDRKVSFTLSDKKDKYVLTVTNLLKESGRYRGRIVLKTDSSVSPEIPIYVSGMIKEKNNVKNTAVRK